jgi:hypothetical protein
MYTKKGIIEWKEYKKLLDKELEKERDDGKEGSYAANDESKKFNSISNKFSDKAPTSDSIFTSFCNSDAEFIRHNQFVFLKIIKYGLKVIREINAVKNFIIDKIRIVKKRQGDIINTISTI